MKGRLLFIFFEVVAEWHPEKDGKESVDDIVPISHYKCWWIGKCVHELSAAVTS